MGGHGWIREGRSSRNERDREVGKGRYPRSLSGALRIPAISIIATLSGNWVKMVRVDFETGRRVNV